jgi:hypothetical protein
MRKTLLLTGTLMAAVTLHATTTSTWKPAAANGDWFNAANWNSQTPQTPVPVDANYQAEFGASNVTRVTIGADLSVRGIIFKAGAPAYTLGLAANTTLSITGGILNNGGAESTLNIGSGAMLELDNAAVTGPLVLNNNAGRIRATDTAVSGITLNNSGVVAANAVFFSGASSIADSVVRNIGAAATLSVWGSTAVSNTTLENTGAKAVMDFRETATLNGSTLENSGANAAFYFRGNAALSDVTMTNSGAGAIIQISDNATADALTVANSGNKAQLNIGNFASLGGVAIENSGAAATVFIRDNATADALDLTNSGDKAALTVNGSATVSGAIANTGANATVAIAGNARFLSGVFENSGDKAALTVNGSAVLGSVTTANVALGTVTTTDTSTGTPVVTTETVYGSILSGGTPVSIVNTGANATVTIASGTRFEGGEIVNSGADALVSIAGALGNTVVANSTLVAGDVVSEDGNVTVTTTLDFPTRDSSPVNITNSGERARLVFESGASYKAGEIVNNGEAASLIFNGGSLDNATVTNNGANSTLAFRGAVTAESTAVTSENTRDITFTESGAIGGNGIDLTLVEGTRLVLDRNATSDAVTLHTLAVGGAGDATVVFKLAGNGGYNQALSIGGDNADIDLTRIAFEEDTANASATDTGVASLTKTGNGTLVLGDKSAFNGDIIVSGGNFTLDNDTSAIGSATLGINGANTTVTFDRDKLGDTHTLGGLSGNGNFTGNGIAFTIGSNNRDTTFSGNFDSDRDLEKTGNGTLTFKSNALLNYSSNLLVTAGTLAFDGATVGNVTEGDAGAGIAPTYGPQLIDVSGGNLSLSSSDISNVTQVRVASGSTLAVASTSTAGNIAIASEGALSFTFSTDSDARLNLVENATLDLASPTVLKIKTDGYTAIRDGESSKLVKTATDEGILVNGAAPEDTALGEFASQLDNALVFTLDVSEGNTTLTATAKQNSFAQERFAKTPNQRRIALAMDAVFEANKDNSGSFGMNNLIDPLNLTAGADLGAEYEKYNTAPLASMAHSTLAQARAELDILDQRWGAYWADREAARVWRNVDRGILRVVGGDADLATRNGSLVRPTSAFKATQSHDQIKYNPWTPYAGVTTSSASVGNDYKEGFDLSTTTLHVGADTMVGKQGLGGVLFSHAKSRADLDRGGRVDTKSYRIAAYGAYYFDNGYILEGNLGIAYQDYSDMRLTGASEATWFGYSVPCYAYAKTTGHSASASVALGKSWYFNVQKNLKFDLLLRLAYDDVTIAAFTEKNANAWSGEGAYAEAVAAQGVNNFRAKLQAAVGKEIVSASGNLWVFRARLSYERQLGDREIGLATTILDNSNQQAVSGANFTVYGPDVPADVFDVGLTAQLITLDYVTIGAHLNLGLAGDFRDLRFGVSVGKRF